MSQRSRWSTAKLGVIGIVLVVIGALLVVITGRSGLFSVLRAVLLRQPTVVERLVPTVPATIVSTPMVYAATPKPVPPASPSPTITPAAQASPLPVDLPATAIQERFGVGVALPPVDQYDVARLRAGWYLDWQTNPDPPRLNGIAYAQMVRFADDGYRPDLVTIEAIAANNPGSLWLIGNEPDVVWQDNVTPSDYARSYHELYHALKKADPSCQVAIGGVSQPTPLRFRYLDMVLEAYRALYDEKLPVDVWNVHAFILREEKDSWGVDIPPGIEASSGVLYEIEDHDDLEIFQQQVFAFRRWMKANGEREKPLIISEYGILMPAEYGFDQRRVRDFMVATFDFFLTAADDELGYAADGNRLVQRWAWYSLNDRTYATGNLVDPDTQQITPLGLAYADYISRLD